MSLPYFPMYPTDFEAKTSHLSIAEDGAYNRLLRICWMTPGCSMPADEAWVMRRVRAVSEADQEAVRAILSEFFTIEKGRYSNARLTREWIAANEAHEKRKNAGAKGGAAKGSKIKEKPLSNAQAMPKQPEPEPEPYKTDTDVSVTRAKPKARKTRIGEDAQVTEAMLRAADKRGHSQQEAQAQFERFKNDAIAKAKTFADWDRAFITWLDSPYFKPITTKGQTNGKRDGEAAERARRAGERWAARAVDFGEDRDASGPLFSAGQPLRIAGGSD